MCAGGLDRDPCNLAGAPSTSAPSGAEVSVLNLRGVRSQEAVTGKQLTPGDLRQWRTTVLAAGRVWVRRARERSADFGGAATRGRTGKQAKKKRQATLPGSPARRCSVSSRRKGTRCRTRTPRPPRTRAVVARPPPPAHYSRPAALTIATMPARTASGRVSHLSTTSANPASETPLTVSTAAPGAPTFGESAFSSGFAGHGVGLQIRHAWVRLPPAPLFALSQAGLGWPSAGRAVGRALSTLPVALQTSWSLLATSYPRSVAADG
jgi:hypothetical protein